MRVLVLLAVFNGSRFLRQQLDSLVFQIGVDVKIIVSDDCSSDDSVDIVNFYIASGHDIEIQQSISPSGSAAANFFNLIERSNFVGYEYVAFADQDDIWELNRLSKAVGLLDKSRAAGYSSAVTAFWPNGKLSVLRQSSRVTKYDYLFEGAGQGCSYVLTAEFASVVKNVFFNAREIIRGAHYHDWMIYIVARSLNYVWFFDPSPALSYRQHDSNDTGAKTSILGFKKRVALISSGWYARQVFIAIKLARKINDTKASDLNSICELLVAADSMVIRVRLSWLLLFHGRRKVLERIFLMLMALLGYLSI